MKAILFNFPMPMMTPRLILRPPHTGDGAMLNEAIIESLDTLSQFTPWALNKPSVDDSEEFVRQAQANWILKENNEPYLPLFLFEKAGPGRLTGFDIAFLIDKEKGRKSLDTLTYHDGMIEFEIYNAKIKGLLKRDEKALFLGQKHSEFFVEWIFCKNCFCRVFLLLYFFLQQPRC